MQLSSVSLIVFVSLQGSAFAENHIVAVGKDMLAFTPDKLVANVDDTVEFQFYPKNHSLASSTFANPCTPISQSSDGDWKQGIWSGFHAVSNSDKTIPTFTIKINDTDSIWLYCSQGDHCQSGMVMAINPTLDKTLAKYKAAAAKAPANISPCCSSGSSCCTATPTSSTANHASVTTSALAPNRTVTRSALSVVDAPSAGTFTRAGVMFTTMVGMAAAIYLTM